MLLLAVVLGLSAVFPHNAEGKATFADCGSSNKKIAVDGGSVKPDPIIYPGNVSMSASVRVLQDLPASGLQMSLQLIKLNPKVMPVPCLKDIGSCTYDVCQMIQNHRDQFCPMFPPKATCGCPMKAAPYNLKNAVVPIPNFGDFFGKMLKGHYNGTITFDDSNTKTQVGCIAVTFEIETSN